MSHKATIKMKITDVDTLKRALDSAGLKYEQAKVTNGLQVNSIYGVRADVDIKLISDHAGFKMQSIGFHKNEDGSYEAIGDFYEVRGAKTRDGEPLDQNSFKKAMSKRYAYAEAMSQLEKAGMAVLTDVQNWNENKISFTMQSAY